MYNENDIPPLSILENFRDIDKAEKALRELVFEHGEDTALRMCSDSLRKAVVNKRSWYVMKSAKTDLLGEILICNAMARVFNPIDIVISFRMAGIKEHVINALLSEVKM